VNQKSKISPGFIKVAADPQFRFLVSKAIKEITPEKMGIFIPLYKESYGADNNGLSFVELCQLKDVIRNLAKPQYKHAQGIATRILIEGSYCGMSIQALKPLITAHAFVDDVAIPTTFAINLQDTKTEEYKKTVLLATYLGFLQTFYIPPAVLPEYRVERSELTPEINHDKLKEYTEIVIRYYLSSMASGRFTNIDAFICQPWLIEKLVKLGIVSSKQNFTLIGSILTAYSIVTNIPIPTVVPGLSVDVEFFVEKFTNGWEKQKPAKSPPAYLVVDNIVHLNRNTPKGE
jgi:hypothetical protein